MWTFNQKLYQILRYYKRYERVFLLFFCQNNKWISVCWSNPRFFHMGGSMGGFYHNSINVWNEIIRLLWLMLHEELWLEFILLINLSMVGISGQSRFLDSNRNLLSTKVYRIFFQFTKLNFLANIYNWISILVTNICVQKKTFWLYYFLYSNHSSEVQTHFGHRLLTLKYSLRVFQKVFLVFWDFLDTFVRQILPYYLWYHYHQYISTRIVNKMGQFLLLNKRDGLGKWE